MSRRLASLALALSLLAPAGGCRLMGGSGGNFWSPFKTAESEDFAEPMIEEADDDWTSFPGRAVRGAPPPREKKKDSWLRRFFESLQDPRVGQINRNVGV
ncbi:MAG: hypothetical protein WD066_17785 [Planctomycetaceae bacterium]